jgi:PBP1b-binding outer membrane lipoprotein LpoB
MKIYQTVVITLIGLLFIGCRTETTPQTPSPTDVLKAYIEASDRKDLAAVKKTFSKGTMKMYEDAAQKRQISVDEVIKDQFESPSSGELKSKIQSGKETIEGDIATVEAKNNVTGELEKIPFVKEDGVWKIAFDKFLEDVINKMREEMKTPASNVSKPDGERQPGSRPETNK